MIALTCIALIACLFALINSIGIARIASLLVSTFDAVFGGAAYRAYKSKWRELVDLRSQISGVSAQDEFAKWARLQRKIDTLQQEWDKMGGERSRQQIANKMKCSLLVRALYYGLYATVLYKLAAGEAQVKELKVPVLSWLMKRHQASIFGHTLIKSDGTVASLLMFTIFTQAANRIFRLLPLV